MAGATIEAFANTFDAYAKHTVLLPSVLTEQADALAANIGFESDQVCVGAVLFYACAVKSVDLLTP